MYVTYQNLINGTVVTTDTGNFYLISDLYAQIYLLLYNQDSSQCNPVKKRKKCFKCKEISDKNLYLNHSYILS